MLRLSITAKRELKHQLASNSRTVVAAVFTVRTERSTWRFLQMHPDCRSHCPGSLIWPTFVPLSWSLPKLSYCIRVAVNALMTLYKEWPVGRGQFTTPPLTTASPSPRPQRDLQTFHNNSVSLNNWNETQVGFLWRTTSLSLNKHFINKRKGGLILCFHSSHFSPEVDKSSEGPTCCSKWCLGRRPGPCAGLYSSSAPVAYSI